MREIPSTIRKPSRYSGCEARRPLLPWEEARVRLLLAFPDVYEIGMSHLGILILHEIANAREGTRAERVFAPWPDMERHLRETGTPLSSLESGRPAREFDVIGFSLGYELTYTNVLQMLDLAGIPLLRQDRKESDPIVVAGGVCTLNPAPVLPFFDAVLVGDGEEALPEILAAARARREGAADRDGTLRRLSEAEGVYVPGLSTRVRRRILPDLSRSPLLPEPILPSMRIVHDRLSVEISRGCTRGCRFCQAGYVYRPVRERDPLLLLRYLQETVPRTGYEEVGLLSLSAADYGAIDGLLSCAMETLSPERISVSLPSIRLDALTDNTVRQIRRVRKTGFTLAPEAGTERLRRAMNKGIRDEELLASARSIYSHGWQNLKLYFMVGLPGETAEDVRAIGSLARRVAQVAREHGKRNRVTISVSAFVPKPHTPFQWERQIPPGEVEERIRRIREEVRRERNVEVKHHAPRVSRLEGILSRGDETLALAILEAYRLGARFDAWTEEFREEAWERAFSRAGVDPDAYLRERDEGEDLPWDFVDAGVTRAFLRRERELARRAEETPDCRYGECSGCGVCAPGLENVTFPPGRLPAGREAPPEAPLAVAPRPVVRLAYAKQGPARHLSGLEIQSLWGRAFRRAGIPLAHSQGFNPSPRISFSPALPVGTESVAEYLEAELSLPIPAAEVGRRLAVTLPPGISLRDVRQVPPGAPRLSDHDLSCTYLLRPAPGYPPGEEFDGERVVRAWESFRAAESFSLVSEREGIRQETDLKPLVRDLRVKDGELSITIHQGTARGARPLDAASAILGVPLPPERYEATKAAAALIPRRKG